MSSQIPTKMLFAEKIRQLREERQLYQRQVSAFLEMDNALYCNIERGDRQAKKEQIIKLVSLFEVATDMLLSLWIADKVIDAAGDEKGIADEVLDIVKQNLINKQ